MIILSHNDMLYILRLNFQNKFQTFDLYNLYAYNLTETRNITQTDIKRIGEGKLAGQFWSVLFKKLIVFGE